MMNDVAVIIPIYKKVISSDELISLCTLKRLDKTYPIIFIGIKEYYDYNYSKLCELLEEHNFKFCDFNELYFKSLTCYSLLLQSGVFYASFLDYKYILVFQLDALIIGGQLEEFVQDDYVYIGAPWFNLSPKTLGLEVGNGGLSLRKTDDFFKIIVNNTLIDEKLWLNFVVTRNRFYKLKFLIFNFIPAVLKLVLQRKSTSFEWSRLIGRAEDVAFSFYLTQNNYPIAKQNDALKFSFETNPRKCFELNDYKLPFGCHAWERYDKLFWIENIPFLNNEK